MDNQAYLQQISAQVRPEKKGPAFLRSKVFRWALIGVVAAIFLMFLASLLSGISNREKELAEQINLRMTNLSQTTVKYQNYLKSSKLRSMNGSLGSVLSEGAKSVMKVMEDEYEYNVDKPNEELVDEETVTAAVWDEKMMNAKLNGVLDDNYAREMALQIMLLMSLESEAMERNGGGKLTQALSPSYENLSLLYTQFSEF